MSDWQEVTDPGSGKVYFYNRKTNATQWDRPAELAIPGGPDADPLNWVRTLGTGTDCFRAGSVLCRLALRADCRGCPIWSNVSVVYLCHSATCVLIALVSFPHRYYYNRVRRLGSLQL